MTNLTKHKGQCLCGLIKYEVTKLESRMAHCHCSMCRKFHGAAFATLGEAKVENFLWISGKKSLKSYLAPNGTTRKFCEHCGSSLIFVPSDDTGEIIKFSLGTLDISTLDTEVLVTNMTINPDAHIYTKFGVNWYKVNDNLPKYTQGRE